MSLSKEALDYIFGDKPHDEVAVRIDRIRVVDDDYVQARLNKISDDGWEVLTEITHSTRNEDDRDKIDHFLLILSRRLNA